MIPAATILLTTRNRKEHLRDALRSAVSQTAPIEILVIDDGSDDGTSDMVRVEFPRVRLERNETSQGYIALRNRGAKLAAAPIVVSIDDDAIFTTPTIVEQTLAEFNIPRVGAVAMPFNNVNLNNIVASRAPGADQIYVTEQYTGTAHAIRRNLFLKLGGYREHLVHQNEEADYCIRMLDAGYVVRLGLADPIHHFESPRRSFARMDYYGRRNDILFAWHNVPWPYLPGHVAATTVRGLRRAFGISRPPWPMLKGIGAGYAGMARFYSLRNPVRRDTYKLSRRLKKSESTTLAEIESQLQPLMPT